MARFRVEVKEVRTYGVELDAVDAEDAKLEVRTADGSWPSEWAVDYAAPDQFDSVEIVSVREVRP